MMTEQTTTTLCCPGTPGTAALPYVYTAPTMSAHPTFPLTQWQCLHSILPLPVPLPLSYGPHDLMCPLTLVQPCVLAVPHQITHLHFLPPHVLVEVTNV